MRIMSVINQKGGCGKTTTAINLSACLAEHGCEVLLIDLDPQSHSSLGLGLRAQPSEKRLYDVLAGEANLKEVLHPVRANLDLVPATVTLAAIEQKLAGTPHREGRLMQAVSGLNRYYDYILIDCPPSLGLLTINALMTSDEALVPLEAGVFSVQGMQRLLETIEMVQSQSHRTIRMKVLVTLFDRRTNHAKTIFNEIAERFGETRLNTVIRQTVRLREAAREGLPINDYDRSSKGYEDYEALAREIMAGESSLDMPPVGEQEFLQTMEDMIRRGTS